MASATPDLRLPSQLQGITAHWLVPNYTARWQRHIIIIIQRQLIRRRNMAWVTTRAPNMCVNNLPRVALDSGEAGIRTRDLLITSPASQPLSHRATLSNKHASHTKLKLNYANHQRAMFVSDTHWPAERIITALTYFFVVKQRDETNAAVIGQTVIATRLYQSLKYTQYIVHSTTETQFSWQRQPLCHQQCVQYWRQVDWNKITRVTM